MDFLDALAQTIVGVVGLASLNHYGSGESWPRAWIFASLFMLCFWLGRFVSEFPARRRRDGQAKIG